MEKEIISFLKKSYHLIKGTVPVVILDDEYIKWLVFANAGMLNKGNLYCIDYVAKHVSSGSPVVEIGSFCGLSTNIINYYFKKYGRKNKLFTCDKWEFENSHDGMLGESGVSRRDYTEFVKDSFKRNARLFSAFNLPYAIESLSDDFFESWKNNSLTRDVFDREITLGGPIAFVFIDGNHSYDFVKKDFENADKYLEKGGYILFDDSAETSAFDCKDFMKVMLANPAYKLVMKNPNYLFVKS